MIFVWMESKCLSIKLLQNGLCRMKNCRAKRLKGVNQIPSCALSDRRYGTE